MSGQQYGTILITALEPDSDGINEWNHDTGHPSVELFSNALQVWAYAQNRRRVTVNEAAVAFNVAPELIRQAVDWHYWMILGSDDCIEHEGE